jgi:hypothetical protein
MQVYCDHPFDNKELSDENLSHNINLQFVETAQLTTENYNDRDWLNDIVREHEPIEFPVFRCPYCEKLEQGIKGYLLTPNRDKPIQLYQFRDGWKMSDARYKASEKKMRDSRGYTTADVRRDLLTVQD